jgi:hypothetical protein
MKYQQLISEFDSKIESLETHHADILNKAENGIIVTEKYIRTLRTKVLDIGFETKIEEIKFFKHIKPHVFSRFVYYVRVFNIESKRPRTSAKFQIKYLNSHINKLQVFFNDNLEFYHYYRRGSTHLDEDYFTRSNFDFRLPTDPIPYIIDKDFSVLHDRTVATIMAYDMLIIYLQKEIEALENSPKIKPIEPIKNLSSKLFWTRSKTELIELIYALQSCGAVNSGTAEIKKLAAVFEKTFNIDLGNYYHTFIEIRARKSSKTKFLDKLTEVLEQRFEDSDE